MKQEVKDKIEGFAGFITLGATAVLTYNLAIEYQTNFTFLVLTAIAIVVVCAGFLPAAQKTATFDFSRVLLLINTVALNSLWEKADLVPNSLMTLGITIVSIIALYQGYRLWRHLFWCKKQKFILVLDAVFVTLCIINSIYVMLFLEADWLSILCVVNFGIISYLLVMFYSPRADEISVTFDKLHDPIEVDLNNIDPDLKATMM